MSEDEQLWFALNIDRIMLRQARVHVLAAGIIKRGYGPLEYHSLDVDEAEAIKQRDEALCKAALKHSIS